MHAFTLGSIPIIVVDPATLQHVIGMTGIVDGHNVEVVDVKEHYAVVKDIDTGEKMKVVWGKLAEWDNS